jgi:hypothetical protein
MVAPDLEEITPDLNEACATVNGDDEPPISLHECCMAEPHCAETSFPAIPAAGEAAAK